VIQRKLYPGYVIVQVEVDEHGNIPQDLWQLIRETSGVGDFIGAEKPWPMRDEEVARMLGQAEEVEEEGPKLKIDFKEGQMVQIREGPFKNVEGYVEEVNPASGKVKVIINIFNRATPVELEYWQVQAL
jgi:transcriptional antiterminator NusG